MLHIIGQVRIDINHCAIVGFEDKASLGQPEDGQAPSLLSVTDGLGKVNHLSSRLLVT
jgi:hypothetical protein